MSKSVLHKGECLHVLPSIEVVVSTFLENYLQIVTSFCNVHFVVPEVQWHQWQTKFILEVGNYTIFKLLNIFIIGSFLSYQCLQICFNFAKTTQSFNNSIITFVHKSDIINFLIFFHHVDDSIKIEDLLNDMIMLIYEHIISYGIFFHHKFDILCKTTSVLSFNNSEFIWISIFFLQSTNILFVIVHSLLSHNSRFILILFPNFGPITHNVNVDILQ